MASWGGAGTGALTGAGIGSAFLPGIGTAIGGALGGLAGLFGGGGRQKKDKFISSYTPEQQQALSGVLGQLGQSQQGNYAQSQDYLSRILGGDQGTFDRFSSPYIQNFEQQILPKIAERFAGLGGGYGAGGALGSSGFGQALGGAGAQLQAQLAGLFSELQQNAALQSQDQYNNLATLGLGGRGNDIYQRAGVSPFNQLLSSVTGGLGEGLGTGLGSGISGRIGQWISRKNSNLGNNQSQSSQGFEPSGYRGPQF